MTATMEAPVAVADLRWRGRVPLAFLLPVGAAAVAVLRYVMPYETTDSAKEIAREVAAHQGTQSAVVWLGFVASLTMVPAVLVATKLARREAPRLAAFAATLMIAGYLSLAWLCASDAAVLFTVRHGMSVADSADAYESLHPVMIVAGAIFVVGHVVGTVLLGTAFLRGSTIPRWAAIALIACQPLHFFAAVILSSHELDLFAWGLNAFVFAVIASVVLRMSDQDWAAA
ncbi:MAG: hypothetical protein ACJ716_12615 [Marmoricola sp.]